MALVGVTSALQQVEAISEPLEQQFGREQLCTGGCELERQREPVESLAELADRRVSPRRLGGPRVLE